MASVVFRILKVEICAFRAVTGSLVFDFDVAPGVSLISGENLVEPELEANGTAKSTLPDAIEWCFFGRTSQGVKGPRVEPWGLVKAPSSVIVTCSINGELCEIARHRNPSALTVTVDEDSRTVDQSGLEEHLGFGPQAFSACVHISQLGSQFLDLPPAQQSEKLGQAMGLDRWLVATKLLSVRAKQLSEELVTLEQRRSHLSGQYEALVVQESELEDQRDEWQSQHDVRVSEQGAQLKQAKSELRGAKRLVAARVKKCEASKDSLAAFEKIQEAYEDKLRGFRTTAAQAAREALAEQPGELEDVCDSCGRAFDDAESKRKHHEAQRAKYADLVKLAKRAKKAIQKAETQAPEDDGSFEDHEAATAKLRKAESELFRAEAKVNRLSESDEDANPYLSQLASVSNRVDKSESDYKIVSAELKELTKQRTIAEYWVVASGKLRLRLLETGAREFERFTSHHLTQLGLPNWRVEVCTERELRSGEMKASMSITVTPQGHNKSVSIVDFSGGERQRLRNALTAGYADFTAARSGLQSMIEFWDEPTHHLSTRGCDDLTLWMQDRAMQSKRRMVLIDHRMSVSGAFDQRWIFRKTEEGIVVDQSK